MKNAFSCLLWVPVLLAVASGSGCLMCCNPQYDAYPAYGGAWQRTDRHHGRVASVIDPAGVLVAPHLIGEVEGDAAAQVEELPPSSSDEATPEGDEEVPLEPLPEGLRPADPAAPLETSILRPR